MILYVRALDTLLVIAVAFFECYCEKNILICCHCNDLGIGQDVIASAQLAANLSMPVLDIPFEALRCNIGGLLERNDTNVLSKSVLFAVLANLNLMGTGLEQESQTGAGQEEDATACVFGIGLEEVQVVKLRETLVHATADTTKRNNVNSVGVFVADPVDCFGEIGRVLISVANDLRRGRLRRVEIANRWSQGIEVANDKLKVRLCQKLIGMFHNNANLLLFRNG